MRWKSPDFEGAGVFSGSMGSCLGVSVTQWCYIQNKYQVRIGSETDSPVWLGYCLVVCLLGGWSQ